MEINLCIPTLNRYDLLLETLESAERGELVPDHYYIIDNGSELDVATLEEIGVLGKTFVLKPYRNLGVAGSWNVFIQDVNEIVIICNDDVRFYEDTIKLLVESYDDNFISYPNGIPSANSFSCFVFPKNILNEVGLFDEEFYPAYYEDNSYHRRMKLKGFDIKPVELARLDHTESGTMKRYTRQEMESHHHCFRRNTELYKRMWGGLPGNETYETPFNSNDMEKTRTMEYLDMRFGY